MGERRFMEEIDKAVESTGDAEEAKGDSTSEKKGDTFSLKRISKKILFLVLFAIAISISVALFLYNRGGQDVQIVKRVKIEGVKRVDYKMFSFFIPVDDGKNFLQLTLSLRNLMADWERKIAENPHIYREAVIKVIETKKISDISNKDGRKKIQKEIEARLMTMTGKGVMEQVYIEEFKLM